MPPAPSHLLGDAAERHRHFEGWVAVCGSRVVLLAAATVLLIILTTTFFLTRKTVTIIADGRETVVHTNGRTVLSALRDARIDVEASDLVSPDRTAIIEDGLVILVERASPVHVWAENEEIALRTQAATVGEALAEARVELGPGDVVLALGQPVHPSAALSEAAADMLRTVASTQPMAATRAVPAARSGQREVAAGPPQPIQLTVKRAVPVVVHDGGLSVPINTAAETVGDALRVAGINVYLADGVRPDLLAPVQANMHVFIERSKLVTIVSDDPEIAPQGHFDTRTRRATFAEMLADEGILLNGREEIRPALDNPAQHGSQLAIRRFRPVSVEVDDRVVHTKTKRATVQEMLEDERIPLGPLDRVSPDLDAEPTDNLVVEIVRVREVIQEEEEYLEYESLVRPNPEIELDHTGYQAGELGVLKRNVKVIYENGLPVDRTVLEEWVDEPPVPEIHYYGTKVVIRQLETPQGTVEYWRTINVLATYYHDSTCGKSPDDPTYGITRTGTTTRLGVVATDPNVIPLWTRMYVPGYGLGVAEDTGGGIKGRHIDLWYPEGNSSWGVRYPTIYLLTPVPGWYPARLP